MDRLRPPDKPLDCHPEVLRRTSRWSANPREILRCAQNDILRATVAGCLVLLVGVFAIARADEATEPAETPPNMLLDAEREAGWKLLFDGTTTNGWRGYKAESMPKSWKVIDGSLVSSPAEGEGLGHIVTTEQYDNFELALEWKAAPGGNSGIIYRATEEKENPWDSGPEYQILDNTGHIDGNNPLASASACYAVFAPERDLTRPVGQWNQTRIVANGNNVEHWLNGEKVLEYEIGTEKWIAHVKTSRFWATPGWGKSPRGHICIQDYGNPIEYRNIKVRPLVPDEK